MKWRSKGDGVQRSYGFGYDQVNRLLSADFSEGAGPTYTDNPNINYYVQMGDGVNSASAYDENGNILAMKQWGIKGLTSDLIDDLQYTYGNNSNQLVDVIDNKNDPNSTLGDFNDRSANYPDGVPGSKYQYDANGNLTMDIHKGIMSMSGESNQAYPGISYNYLNLPSHVPFYNMQNTPTKKGDIYFIYDAGGTKLAKHVIDYGTALNANQKKFINTTYSNGFVYQSSGTNTNAFSTCGPLQFLSMEEGRIRPVTLADGTASYAFDYMIKDHLGNVRSMLTDEQHQDMYPAATMEPANATTEKKYYSKIDETHTPKSGITCYPSSDPYTDPNDYVSRVNGTDNKMGPGITLK